MAETAQVRYERIVAKLRKAKNTHTNPVEISISDLEWMLAIIAKFIFLKME